jgi:O-antigen/teichoic acid export membrane protein
LASDPAPRTRTAFLVAAGTNWLAFAATLAVSFLLTPYLIAALGTDRYGVWCVVESVLAYFTLLDMGVAACLVRYVARHHAAGERAELNRLASSCLALFLAAGGVALAVGAPVLWAMAPRLDAKAGGPGNVLPFTLLMLANLAATLPLSVFPSVLDGLERFAAKSGVRLAFLAARTAGIVAVADRGLVPLAVVYTVTNLAEHAVMAVVCFRLLPGLRFRPSLVDRATLRTVRTYSVDAFLAMLAGRVTLQTGAIVIGLLLPAGLAAVFVSAVRLVEYAKTLLRTVTTTLTPGVSAMEARGDMAGVRRLFLSATRWVLYAVLPVNLGLWFFGGPFLRRWVPTIGADAYPPLAVLAATLGVGVAQSVASRVLYGLGRLRLFARAALAEGVVNVLLTAALVGPLGVVGVAVAVAVPNVLFCVFVIGYTLRVLEITGRDYLSACVRPVLANLVPAAVWVLVGAVEPAWGAIAAGIVAGLLPYAAVVGCVEFAAPLRTAATRVFGRRVPATLLR